MTEERKRQLLFRLEKGQLSRAELKQFCSNESFVAINAEIDLLCREKLIKEVSTPQNIMGYCAYRDDDLFDIDDAGRDYLADKRKDSFRFWLPIVISVLALIVSVIALLK